MAIEHREKVILVRIETSPEDIHGMHAAQGILTARGGMTSHAAVVARGMGKPCVSGAGELRIDYAKKELKVGQHTIKEGDIVTINGGTGEVTGHIPHDPQMIPAAVEGRVEGQAAREIGASTIEIPRREIPVSPPAKQDGVVGSDLDAAAERGDRFPVLSHCRLSEPELDDALDGAGIARQCRLSARNATRVAL